MAYKRKTKDVFVVEIHRGAGWEKAIEADTLDGIMDTLLTYKAQGLRVRWRRRIVPV